MAEKRSEAIAVILKPAFPSNILVYLYIPHFSCEALPTQAAFPTLENNH